MRVLLVLPESHHWFMHAGDIPPLGIAYVHRTQRSRSHGASISSLLASWGARCTSSTSAVA